MTTPEKIKIHGEWYDPRDLQDELEGGETSSVFTYLGVVIAALGGSATAVQALAVLHP